MKQDEGNLEIDIHAVYFGALRDYQIYSNRDSYEILQNYQRIFRVFQGHCHFLVERRRGRKILLGVIDDYLELFWAVYNS